MSSSITLLDIGRLFFFSFIVAVSVLAVDWLVLLLLDHSRNLDTLLLLVFLEGVGMMLVSTAGWGVREHDFFVVGWRRAETHHISYRPRYSNFWLTVAIAGLILMLIDLYIFSQYY